jgi:serine/threonine protein kinase
MAPPARIGKYEIVELIGRGGMGVVYKARDTVLGRLVALKLMTAGLADNAEVRERFLREARAVSMLQHANIVVVFELGEHEENPYIVMEYLDGEPLDRTIRNQAALTVLQKIDIILQVAKALQYAHERGIVHRDIKPGNIMLLRDGTVKVVDFGIAHLADQTITRSGLVLGTVSYMSPEQLNGQPVDARTDIFSLGIVFYVLLTGKLPFEGASTAETMLKILTEPPPRLSQFGDVNPPELQPIVDRALAKKKEGRYQTCAGMAEALAKLRKTFEVQTQLAALERERKALLAQLDRQGPSAALQPQDAAPSQATHLPQVSPPSGDSVLAPTQRHQYTEPGQPRSRGSKRLAWIMGGLSIMLATAVIVTGTYIWSSRVRATPAPTPTPQPPSTEPKAPDGQEKTVSLPSGTSPAERQSAVTQKTAPPKPTPLSDPSKAVGTPKSHTAPEGVPDSPTRKPVPGAEELAKANNASDAAAAAAWLWKATAKGNPEAPVRLADMYVKGDGVPRSCEQALVLLNTAATKENAQAHNRLAAMYSNGTCVQRNLVKAYRWLNSALAADPNNRWARQNRDSMWQEMTPEERATEPPPH